MMGGGTANARREWQTEAADAGLSISANRAEATLSFGFG